ncbi:MAG TPA: WecB/TagA/CpsF family glycosyltransferase, partial [Bacillota bacterium]
MSGRKFLSGIPVDIFSTKESLERTIYEWLQKPEKSRQIVTLNARMLMAALVNPELHKAICKADLVLVDGYGIELALRRREGASALRIAGIDLIKELLRWGSKQGLPVFFYGGTLEVAQGLRDRVPKLWPGLAVQGIWDGYGIELCRDQVQREILHCQPRLLLVGLGTPAQEFFLVDLLPHLPGTVGIGVGGALEVLAGIKAEAPPWLRKHGGEWLFR